MVPSPNSPGISPPDLATPTALQSSESLTRPSGVTLDQGEGSNIDGCVLCKGYSFQRTRLVKKERRASQSGLSGTTKTPPAPFPHAAAPRPRWP